MSTLKNIIKNKFEFNFLLFPLTGKEITGVVPAGSKVTRVYRVENSAPCPNLPPELRTSVSFVLHPDNPEDIGFTAEQLYNYYSQSERMYT